MPIYFDTDREAIERCLASLALDDPSQARVVRIADTLSLAEMDVSETLWAQVKDRPGLTALSGVHDFEFDAEHNLTEQNSAPH
jgi:hypothetical protein